MIRSKVNGDTNSLWPGNEIPFGADLLPENEQQLLAEVLDECLKQLDSGNENMEESVDSMLEEHRNLRPFVRQYIRDLHLLNQADGDLFAEPSTPEAQRGERKQRKLGDFVLEQEIGRGGMGVVYQARQLSLDRLVALKVLPLAATLDDRKIARFQREAQAAAQLQHPHIVPVHSVGEAMGVHFFSMQLIDGQTLGDVLRDHDEDETERDPANGHRADQSTLNVKSTVARQSTFSSRVGSRDLQGKGRQRTMVRWAIQASQALDHAHSYGILHRDVKPSNLLVDGKGKLWVTDFGLARLQTDTQMTESGDLLGTLPYMSPEQASGKIGLVDQRTDVYSLGATLYEMLTSHTLFKDSDRLVLLQEIQTTEPKRPRKLDASIPVDLENVVLKAISKDRERRYESCADLAEDLTRFLEGRPTLAKKPSVLECCAKWAARHQLLVAATVLLLFVATIGTSVASILLAQTRDEAREQTKRAHATIDELHWAAEQLRGVPGAELARAELLMRTLRYYEQFAKEAKNETTLQVDLARTQLAMGRIFEQIGEWERALETYEAARGTFEQLVDDDGENIEHKRGLALAWNNIGLLQSNRGQSDEATRSLRRAKSLQSRLIESVDQDCDACRADFAVTLCNLALHYSQFAKHLSKDEAKQNYLQAIEVLRQIQGHSPEDPGARSRLAVAYNNLSRLLASSDVTESKDCLGEAIEIQRQLVKQFPEEPSYQGDLAKCENNLGTFFEHEGNLDDAKAAFQRAIDLNRELRQKAPAVLDHSFQLAVSLNNLGRIEYECDELNLASKHFDESLEIVKRLQNDNPEEACYKASRASVLGNIAAYLFVQNRFDLAKQNLEIAIKLFEELLVGDATNEAYQRELGNLKANLEWNQKSQSDRQKGKL